MTTVIVDNKERPDVSIPKDSRQAHISWADFYIILDAEDGTVFFKRRDGDGKFANAAIYALRAEL